MSLGILVLRNLAALNMANDNFVSKETGLPCRWGGEKCKIITVKRLRKLSFQALATRQSE